MSFTDKYLLKDTLELKDKYKIKTIVESGCHEGHSLDIFIQYFEFIYSCDLDKVYSERCKEKFKNNLNVKIENLSGELHLEKLINENKLNDKFILYSDGHNFQNNRNSSELLELDILIKYNIKPLILIHDFKNPFVNFQYDIFDVGENSINLIKDKLDILFGGENYKIEYNKKSEANVGWIFIIPNEYDN